MAARVNTKFVVILGVSLVALVMGMLGYYFLVIQKDPAVKVEEGNRLLAEGRIADAAKRFEQAVGRDPTRVDLFELWHDTVLKVVPKNDQLNNEFYDKHLGILNRVAELLPMDAERQEAYLAELWERSRLLRAYDDYVLEANLHINNLVEGDDKVRVARYRGLANVRRMEILTEMSDEERDGALEDLTAAYELNPDDWEAGLGIVRWHYANVAYARNKARSADAAASMEKTLEAHASFMSDNPDHPQGLLLGFVLEQDRIRRGAVDLDAQQAVVEQLRPMAMHLLEVAETAPAEDLDTGTFLQLFVSQVGRFPGGMEKARGVIDRVAAARPDDLELKMLRAQVLRSVGDFDAALAELEAVASAEDGTISLEQIMLPTQRLNALATQIEVALSKRDAATEIEDQRAALDAAKAYCAALEERVTSNFQNVLTFREAQIAFVDGRYPVTVAKCSELQKTELGDDPQVGLLMARALAAQGNHGEAISEYRKLPRTPSVLYEQARQHIQLQDRETALTLLYQAREGAPGSETIAELISGLEGLGEGEQGSELVRRLVEARKARLTREYDTARTILNRLREDYPDDRRVFIELVYNEMNAEDRDAALQLVNAALDKFPNDAEFRRQKTFIMIEDPVQARIEIVNNDETLSDVQKMIGRYHVYSAAAKRSTANDDAAAARTYAEQASSDLEAALKAASNDAVVVEVAFVDAIEKKDFARMAELKDRAARYNLDNLDGMLYQARFELTANDDFEAAERVLSDALDRIPSNPPARRLLGQVQRNLGKDADALESLKLARAGRPDDMGITKEYLALLIEMNRPVEALQAVKAETGGALRFAPTDVDLVNLWLDLEAQVGDRSMARTRRLEYYQSNPEDVRNTVALANIYAGDNRWDQVDGIVQRLSGIEGQEGLVASLRTRSLLAQGQPEQAVATYEAYVDTFKDNPDMEVTVSTWTVLGELLAGSGYEDRAIAAFDKARALQDPKEREADRRLADYYFSQAAAALTNAEFLRDQNAGARAQEQVAHAEACYTKALNLYKDIVDAGSDSAEDGYKVTKRLVETYIRQEKADEARPYLERLTQSLPNDLEVYMLRSNFAQLQGDVRKARAVLAEAIGNPKLANQPEPFMQRVLLNREEPELFNAVIADLDEVHRLDPSDTRAWALRFAVHREHGRPAEAFTELRRGIKENPAADELRLLLLRELLEANRLEEAAAEVIGVVQVRPDSVEWKARAANVLSKLERWPEVARYYREVYDATDEVNAAIALLDARLRTPERTTIQEVNGLMQRIVNDKEHDASTVANTMLRGRAYAFLKKEPEAESEFVRGLEAAKGDAARLQLWIEQLTLAKGGPVVSYNYIEGLDLTDPDLTYLRVQLANFKALRGEEDMSTLLARVADVDETNADPLTLRELYRLRSRLHYELGEYSVCVDWLRKAVEVAPGDVELYNNLAYLLSNEVSDPEAALVFAEKAAELRPLSSTVLDTLGWTYHLLDRDEEAVKALRKAVNTATSDSESLIANIHLGLVYASMNQMSDARMCRNQAEDIARTNGAARDEYRDELDQLIQAAR